MESLIDFLKETGLSPDMVDFYQDFFEAIPWKNAETKQKTIDDFIMTLKQILEVKPKSELKELLEIKARGLESFVLGDLDNHKKAINDFFNFLKNHTA